MGVEEQRAAHLVAVVCSVSFLLLFVFMWLVEGCLFVCLLVCFVITAFVSARLFA